MSTGMVMTGFSDASTGAARSGTVSGLVSSGSSLVMGKDSELYLRAVRYCSSQTFQPYSLRDAEDDFVLITNECLS